MLDGAGKWWEIFKSNVKVNPFEVFTYARNIYNRDRPIRSAVMLLALVGGMAGGAALFLTVADVNHWAETIVLQGMPQILLDALRGVSHGLEKAFVQTFIGVLGAYIGNAVVGTTVKQLWRGINKTLFGTTNSLYDLTAGDLDAILKKNPQYSTTPVPQHEEATDQVKFKLNQWIPMHWMSAVGRLFSYDVVPEGVRADRLNLWNRLQFVRDFKKRQKHDGTGRDGGPKFALNTLINGEYSFALDEFIEKQAIHLERKRDNADENLTLINEKLGEDFDLAAPVDLGVHQQSLHNHLLHLKRIQAGRDRFRTYVHETGSIKTNADLHKLKLKVQQELHEAERQLEAIAPYRHIA
jgi:hypothetical protein